jgi:excisionase family DNA binding protein
MSTHSRPEGVSPLDWISQAEAARLRGVSRQAIAKLVRLGRVRTLEIGGHMLVHRADIEAFERRPGGRPRMTDSIDTNDAS